MLRHGCEERSCRFCPRGKRRPSVYTARAFAQQYLLANKPLCPRVAHLFVPLINFSRPPAPESLIMRVRSGRVPKSDIPLVKPPIGIIVRPQHVHKQPKKAKEPIKEKPTKDVGQYKLRRLSGQSMEKVHPRYTLLMRLLKSQTTPKTIPFYNKFCQVYRTFDC
jgi:hypothetical protein